MDSSHILINATGDLIGDESKLNTIRRQFYLGLINAAKKVKDRAGDTWEWLKDIVHLQPIFNEVALASAQPDLYPERHLK